MLIYERSYGACEITQGGESKVPFSKSLLSHLEASFGTEGQLETSLRLPCGQWSRFKLGRRDLSDIVCKYNALPRHYDDT